MRKLLFALFTLCLVTTGTAFASPTTNFEKGSVTFEIGTSTFSKVSGQGTLHVSADGKSGYKYAVTAGLGNNWAVQFKQGIFRSEDSTVSIGPATMTTYAEGDLIDVNLLHKINPHLTMVVGYEHDKVSYGQHVNPASKSSLHFGFTATQDLSKNTALFGTLLMGSGVSLKEIGVSQKLSPVSTLNVSYAERKFDSVDLTIPAIGFRDKMEYKLTGVTCVVDFKL